MVVQAVGGTTWENNEQLEKLVINSFFKSFRNKRKLGSRSVVSREGFQGVGDTGCLETKY